jgi:hypothetical protein
MEAHTERGDRSTPRLSLLVTDREGNSVFPGEDKIKGSTPVCSGEQMPFSVG